MAHARVSTYQFGAERVDEARTSFEGALRSLQDMEGIEEALLLVDRDSGKGITITTWKSEDALRASEQAADEVRQQAATLAGGEITSVERYEIAMRQSF